MKYLNKQKLTETDIRTKFTNTACKYPVIATTSKLMTMRVYAKTCKLIVFESNNNFKQIIRSVTIFLIISYK